MNTVVHHTALPADYSLSSADNECIDSLNSHHPQHSYSNDSHLRRDHHHQSNYLSGNTTTNRYLSHRPTTHEGQFHPGAGISDSNSGSISTSPSSNSSSLVSQYPTSASVYHHQANHQGLNNPPATHMSHLLPSSAAYPPPYAPQSAMSGLRQRGTSMSDYSSNPGMLPPARSPGIANQVSPSLGTTMRENYTTSPSYLHRPPHSPRSSHVYHSIPEIPRTTLLPIGMPMSPQPASHYGASTALLGYSSTQHDRHETPPFEEQTNLFDVCSSSSESIIPKIEAKIEKGFFMSSDRVWTCYRRNYFSVQASYSMSPHPANERLYFDRPGKARQQIQALAMSLSAAVDGPTGKIIELIQHTPKRDKGPQLPIGKEKLLPAPPGKPPGDHTYPLTNTFHGANTMGSPYLPMQQEPEPNNNQSMQASSHSHNVFAHTFERIQFKSATANNGKRRAQQQYYHLIVELWADIRTSSEQKAEWVKIAQRVSAAVVVRGRSPSHYSNEGPSTSGTSRQGGHGGSSAGGGHGSYGASGMGGYGRSINTQLAGSLFPQSYGGGAYRPAGHYSHDPSPVGSHSVSSASSITGGPIEGFVGDQTMEDSDHKQMDGLEGYQYYPAPLYEAGLHPNLSKAQLPLPTFDESRKVKEEYNSTSVAFNGWSGGGCGKLMGVQSSRGYYPDLQVPQTY